MVTAYQNPIEKSGTNESTNPFEDANTLQMSDGTTSCDDLGSFLLLQATESFPANMFFVFQTFLAVRFPCRPGKTVICDSDGQMEGKKLDIETTINNSGIYPNKIP